MADNPVLPADSVAVWPSDCSLCKAELERNWMAQIHYRTLANEAGPECAIEAFNEDFAEDHATHIDGTVCSNEGGGSVGA